MNFLFFCSPSQYRSALEASNLHDNTTPSPVFTGDTEYLKELDFFVFRSKKTLKLFAP